MLSRLPTHAIAAGLAFAATAFALGSIATGTEEPTHRVSVSSAGDETTGASQSVSVSRDGRYIVFSSDAPNLIQNDINSRDIFVHDRELGTTELVSVSSDGTQANRPASFPSISENGRFVVFESEADNLVPDDTNEASDIFCRDLVDGTTFRVSLASDGSQANAASFTPSSNGDGRYITFTSLADNLVEDDTNSDRDVFVHDLQTGTTERISVSTEGVEGNSASGGLGAGPARISGDGRFVVFGSFASNLSAGDENLRDDVFLRDKLLETTTRVSTSTGGSEGNGHSFYGDVSDDGRYVVFHSAADNLVADDENDVADIFLHDTVDGTTTRISLGLNGAEADGTSEFARISADGSLVAFQSLATNLVQGDTNFLRDIFVQALAAHRITRVSFGPDGLQSNGHSSFAALSADGRLVAYQSLATNLVLDDTNEVFDVFASTKLDFVATPEPTLEPTATATPLPAAEVGDVDCSGAVTSIDAALVLQFVANLLVALSCEDAADVNANGDVNSIDAALILQFTAGFFDSLPP